MFDFGWAELLVIIAVAVLVIGPQDIPKVMYGIGRLARRLQYVRFAVSQQFDDILKAGDIEELRRGVNFETAKTDEKSADGDDVMLPQPAVDGVVDTKTLYKRIADAYDKSFSDPSDGIDEFLLLLPENANVLDAGCGNGIDAAYLESKGHQVNAFDLSEEMLSYARERTEEVTYTRADFLEFDYGVNLYDGILASYSLIHLPKKILPQALSRIYKGLKDGGYFFVGMQSGESAEQYIDEPLVPDTRFFMNVVSRDELEGLLTDAGFTIVKTHERPADSKEELSFVKLRMIAQK